MRVALKVVWIASAFVLCAVSQLGAFELARGANALPLSGIIQPAEYRGDVEESLLTSDNQGPLSAPEALEQAAADWAQTQLSTLILSRLDDAATPSADHGFVEVSAIRQNWPAEFGSAAATVAFTVVEIDENLHKIRSAQIYLNAQGFDFSSTDTPRRMDLQGTLAHELGHAIGLEHSCGEPFGTYPNCDELPIEVQTLITEATMYPRAGTGNIWQRVPATDDVNGLRVLYPCSGDCASLDAGIADRASFSDVMLYQDSAVADVLQNADTACVSCDAGSQAFDAAVDAGDSASPPGYDDEDERPFGLSCAMLLTSQSRLGTMFFLLVVLAWRRRGRSGKNKDYDV